MFHEIEAALSGLEIGILGVLALPPLLPHYTTILSYFVYYTQ